MDKFATLFVNLHWLTFNN